MPKKRKYLVSTRCVDKYNKYLYWRDPIYEFYQKLDDEINLRELAYIISRKVFEHRELKFFKSLLKDDIYKMFIEDFYKVEEFRLNSFSFGVTDDETLADYLRVDNNQKLKLEVYLVVQLETQHCAQEIYKDISQQSEFVPQCGLVVFDETLGRIVSKDQAPRFIAKMKPGMLIVADCPTCEQKVLRQVKLFKNRTATFNLKKGIKCPKCNLHLSDLDSPYLTECEYNYQGEKSDGQIVYNFGWKTVQANHILYFKEDEHQIIDWIELKIFIRVFDTRYCTACQQKLEGDNEKDIEDNCFKGQCGHRYHTTCFKQVAKNGKGYCVAEGCNVKFAVS